MPKYNTEFTLGIDDIDLIEKSLRLQLSQTDDADTVRRLNELLGHLHQQKIWYRPDNKPYISG